MPTTTRRSPNIPRAAEFPAARPLTANQQRRRARILDATRCLVIKHGYDGMIMRDVAATAEVSATTLYNLYNTKDELLLEALRERVTNTTARAVRKSGGPGCAYLLAHVSSVCQETRKSPAYVGAIAQALFRASPGDPLSDVLLIGLRRTTLMSLMVMKDQQELVPGIAIDRLATALTGSFWSVFLLWDKGLVKLTDLESVQLNGYLSLLIPAVQGSTLCVLERRYRKINGL